MKLETKRVKGFEARLDDGAKEPFCCMLFDTPPNLKFELPVLRRRLDVQPLQTALDNSLNFIQTAVRLSNLLPTRRTDTWHRFTRSPDVFSKLKKVGYCLTQKHCLIETHLAPCGDWLLEHPGFLQEFVRNRGYKEDSR
jgi:hypothetical protein